MSGNITLGIFCVHIEMEEGRDGQIDRWADGPRDAWMDAWLGGRLCGASQTMQADRPVDEAGCTAAGIEVALLGTVLWAYDSPLTLGLAKDTSPCCAWLRDLNDRQGSVWDTNVLH